MEYDDGFVTPDTPFGKALDYIFKTEGGYVNDPRDPGGETKYGISKKRYPGEDIPNLTRQRAAFLYKRDFWDRVRGDDLGPALGTIAFDFAVQHGGPRARRALRAVVGLPENGKPIDSQAIRRLRKISDYRAAKDLLGYRADYLLARGAAQPHYARGFAHRLRKLAEYAGTIAEGSPRTQPINEDERYAHGAEGPGS